MASLRDRVGSALQRIAARPQSDDFIAIGSIEVAGEPVLWEETIAFERGGFQTFSRIRSPVDEGGAAIGTWSMPADDWQTQPLAAALCQVDFWNHKSEADLMPGMNIVNWSCVTREGTLDLMAAGTSPLVQQLAPLDLELRRLANDLENSHQGASLRVTLDVQQVGRNLAVRVGLVNDGNSPCIVINPFSIEETDLDYFRLESALMVPEEPGVTGYGADFQAAPWDLPGGGQADFWQDTYLLVSPGRPLVMPEATLGPLVPGSYLLRAVYSNYGLLRSIAGVPVIRGRAFSNEAELTI